MPDIQHKGLDLFMPQRGWDEKCVPRARRTRLHRPSNRSARPVPQVSLDVLTKALERAFGEIANKLQCASQEMQFNELATQWKRETRFVSNVTTKSMHIAYQRIIGMGPAAVPLIMNDLTQNGPSDW